MEFGIVAGIGTAALLLAVPGLGLRRFGPLSVRLAALVVLLSLWFAALDWPLSTTESRQPRVQAITTVQAQGSLMELRARLLSEQVSEFRLRSSSGSLAERLLQARLQDPDAELLLVWNGSFSPAERSFETPLTAIPLSSVSAPLVEPEWFQLRALGSLRAERSTALELRLTEEAVLGPWRGKLTLGEDASAAIVAVEFESAELAEPLLVPIPALDAGQHPIELAIELPDSALMRASGILQIAAAPVLRIIGEDDRARQFAAALDVQGMQPELLAELPAELAGDQVLVICARMTVEEQSRLVEFVDAGGGLFLVGDENGGALPLAGEPLHDMLPVVMPERLSALTENEGAGDGAGGAVDPSAEPTTQEEKAEPEPSKAEPPKDETSPPPDQQPKPENLPQGDVSAAAPPDSLVTEDVQRRMIALMLIVDRSGSMGQPSSGGRSKMDDAKRSAYDTAYNLEDGDELGLIAFGEQDRQIEVLRLGPRPKDAELRQALARLRAEAPRTQLGSALSLALTRLKESRLPVRHTVVLTDGNLPDFTDVTYCRTVAARMAEAGITLSIIQVLEPGDSSSPLDLKRISDAGRGVLHRSRSRGAIPSLVFSEVKRVLGSAGRRPASEEGGGDLTARADASPVADPPAPEPKPPEPPVVEPEPEAEPEPKIDAPESEPASDAGEAAELRVRAVSPSILLDPEPADGFPSLRGVLPVTGRAEARVLLAAGEQGVPLLAFANRGLGRIAVWSSDFFGPWGGAWSEDPQLPGRLATWTSALRPASDLPLPEQLLVESSLEPQAPTRAERQRMEELTARRLAPLADYAPAAASLVVIEKGRAAEFAIWALLSLALLALVEFSLRRSAAFS